MSRRRYGRVNKFIVLLPALEESSIRTAHCQVNHKPCGWSGDGDQTMMTLNGSGMSDFAVCSNNWNFCSNTILYERKTSKTLGPLKFTVPFWNAGFLSCLGDESKESYSLYYIGRIDITGKRDNYFKTYHRFLQHKYLLGCLVRCFSQGKPASTIRV